MTDSVIESALQKQPREIQHYAAEKIVKKLKKRRKNFSKDMMKYYHHLSKVVSVPGSNEDEIFQVVNSIDGHVLVTVKGKNGNGIYERVFDPAVTKEIRLYGLEGKDQFNFEGGESKIRIRVVGGPGEDQVINNSADKKVWVYDVDAENNVVKGTTDVKDRISADPMNNEYERLGHRFDESKFGVYSEYAFDGGFYAGAKYRITRHGFRKEPYAVQHEFILAHTFAVNSFLARYKGDFIKAIGNTDILVRGEYFGPTARTNFFGLGNETVFDQNKSGGIKYYRARYDLANLTVLAKSPIYPWMDVRVGPTFQYLQLRKEENEGRYISTLDHTVSDDNQLHEANFYGGAEAQFNINTKNNELLPTRGADFNSTLRYLIPLKGSSSNLTQLFSTLALYSDFLSKDKLVFATRFGFAHNIGNYHFAQAQYLGFRENLRGFRIHRFAGRTSAYNNVELRWKIADWKTPIVPAAIGLLAFNDVGRVWTENENSNIWHDGYGAGIWLAPMNKLVITGTLSYSKEEKNFALLTLGFQF